MEILTFEFKRFRIISRKWENQKFFNNENIIVMINR